MAAWKKELPEDLSAVLALVAKVDWWKVYEAIKKIRKFIAVFKAIAAYATPEEKAQLADIYDRVLTRAKADEAF